MPQQDFDLILKVQADLQQATKQLRSLNDGMRVTSSSAKQASGSLDRMERSADSGAKGVGRITKQIDGMSGSVKSAATHLKALVAVIGVAFVARKVVDFTRGLIDANEQLFQLAKRAEGLNVSVKFFSGLTEQADDLGIGVQQVAVVMGTLNRQLATAQRGSATAKGMFAEFGIDPATIHSTENAFLGVADSVEKYGLNAKRAGILTQIFGASGKDIVPILKNGAAAIRAQNDAMEKTGQIITDAQVPAIVQLHNATDNIGDSFTALRNTLIIQLAPAISDIADQFNTFVTTQGPELVRTITDATQKLPDLVRNLAAVASAAATVASTFADATHGLEGFLAWHMGGAVSDNSSLEAAVNKRNALLDELNARSQPRSALETAGNAAKGWFFTSIFHKSAPQMDADELRDQINILNEQIQRYQKSKQTLADTANSGVLTGKDVPAWMKAGLGGNTSQSVGGASPVDPKGAAAAAAAARQIAQQAAAAQAALTQVLIQQKAKVDPAAAAWMTYSVAESNANAAAATLIKQNPKQAAAIHATRDAQIQLAAIARDSKLDAIAAKDEQAWQSLLDSLRTPAEVNVDTALAQLALLNNRLAEGKISAEEYHATVGKIAAQSVTAAPQYQGLDAAVGGIGSELTKNFRAQADLDTWHQQALAANEAFRAKDAANEEAYQARLADINAQYAQQRGQIEHARGQLQLQTTANIFGQLASLSASHNAKMATIGKAAAIAQAIINTYQSATDAYKSLAGIPYVGPALGAAAAAAAIAAGLANVAQIRAQPTGGYATGGYTGAGGRHEPAGIVHRGEGVLSQDDIRALGGPSGFLALRRGLRGYADGGLVAGPSLDSLAPRIPVSTRPSLRLPAPASGSVGGAGGRAQDVKVVVVMDRDAMAEEIMRSPVGQKVIVQTAGDNPRAIQGKWGR